MRVRAALMVPLAVETVALYSPREGRRPKRAAERLVQRNHGGAGVDHEADPLAVDAAFGLKVATAIAGNGEAAPAGRRRRSNRNRRARR